MNDQAAETEGKCGKSPESTLIAVILDRSGSMGVVRTATIKGFNDFLHEQQKLTDGGNALMSLTQFDHQYEVNFVGESIANIPDLDTESYVPRGNTALYDAIGRTIQEVETWTKKNDWQQRVLMLIVTDGQENASREFDFKTVSALIAQKEKEGWNVSYMGANQDSFAVGAALNIRPDFIANYDQSPAGAAFQYSRMSRSTANFRSLGSKGPTSPRFFDPSEQKPSTAPDTGKMKPNNPVAGQPPKKSGGVQWLKNWLGGSNGSA